MALAMVWSTQGAKFGSIFEAINKMPAQFLAPPITTVFVWGVFWRRGTFQAALATLLLGFSFGMVEFLVDLPIVGDTQLITQGLGISFMMQAWWNFCICSVIFFTTSLMTNAPETARIEGLTWPNPLRVVFYGRPANVSDPRIVALAIVIVMALLYWLFR
jgi:SSS family solute:Na+ symporter